MGYKSDEPQLHLLLELEAEAARWRRRSMFLLSVLLHAVVIVFLLVEPEIFRRGAQMMGIAIEPRTKRETTYLYMPPAVLKPPQAMPDTNILSDKNRRAQGRSPTVESNT